MPTTKKKPRNPSDATLRNVRAAKKRTLSLSARVKELERLLASLSQQVTKLEEFNGLVSD